MEIKTVADFKKNPGRPKPDDVPAAPRDPCPILGPIARPDTDWSDMRPDIICRPTGFSEPGA